MSATMWLTLFFLVAWVIADPCLQFKTCADCFNKTVGNFTCGWCVPHTNSTEVENLRKELGIFGFYQRSLHFDEGSCVAGAQYVKNENVFEEALVSPVLDHPLHSRPLNRSVQCESLMLIHWSTYCLEGFDQDVTFYVMMLFLLIALPLSLFCWCQTCLKIRAVYSKRRKVRQRVQSGAVFVEESAMFGCSDELMTFRLFHGRVVWWNDVKKDLWFRLKNEHVLFSMVWSHPLHPLSKSIRRWIFAVSVLGSFIMTVTLAGRSVRPQCPPCYTATDCQACVSVDPWCSWCVSDEESTPFCYNTDFEEGLFEGKCRMQHSVPQTNSSGILLDFDVFESKYDRTICNRAVEEGFLTATAPNPYSNRKCLVSSGRWRGSIEGAFTVGIVIITFSLKRLARERTTKSCFGRYAASSCFGLVAFSLCLVFAFCIAVFLFPAAAYFGPDDAVFDLIWYHLKALPASQVSTWGIGILIQLLRFFWKRRRELADPEKYMLKPEAAAIEMATVTAARPRLDVCDESIL